MGKGEKNLTSTVGKAIQARRKSAGMSQAVLAEIVGIEQQSLSSMEQGKIAPKFERLQSFADALQCRVVDLFMSPEASVDSYALMLSDLMQSLSMEQRTFVLGQTEGLIRFLVTQNRGIHTTGMTQCLKAIDK